MNFEVVNQVDYVIDETRVKECLKLCCDYFQIQKAMSLEQSGLSIYLVFVSTETIKDLNSKFRDKNKPTDVLSFAPNEDGFLGELVFCPDVISSQAKDNNHSENLEFNYLLIHGVLHLLGFDHEESQVEAKEMFALQDHVFDLIRNNTNTIK
jgi:probable rRNA maturation factor